MHNKPRNVIERGPVELHLLLVLLKSLNSQGERKKKKSNRQSLTFNHRDSNVCVLLTDPQLRRLSMTVRMGKKCFLFYRHLKYVKV